MMRKLLVISLVVLSAVVFAGKLSFSGSLDVTPWVSVEFSPGAFQAQASYFGKCVSWSVNGTAVSDYGFVGFSLKSGSLWTGYIKTPLVEATDVTLVLQGGMFSAGFTAAGGGSMGSASSYGGCNVGSCDAECDTSWSKDPTISDYEFYSAANMLILDYKDALSIRAVAALCQVPGVEEPQFCADLDVYTRFLLLDPVWLFVDLHDLASSSPYIVLMGALDAGKEAGFPLGFAFRVDYQLASAQLSGWYVGGWFDFDDPLSIYWKLYNSSFSVGSTDFYGVVTVHGLEMLKGDWSFGIDFQYVSNAFAVTDFGFTGTYSHVKDAEISYYPGLVVRLPVGSSQSNMKVEAWITAEFTFELPYPETGEE